MEPYDSSEHDPDHGEDEEGAGEAYFVLEVLREPSAPAHPGEAALDDPAFGQHDEVFDARRLGDDLEGPVADGRHFGLGGAAFVAGVCENSPQGRAPLVRRLEHRRCAVTILDVRRMYDGSQQQAKRVYDDMALAALDLFARVIARRIGQGPPFSAPRALWLSIMPRLGSVLRPARARTSP